MPLYLLKQSPKQVLHQNPLEVYIDIFGTPHQKFRGQVEHTFQYNPQAILTAQHTGGIPSAGEQGPALGHDFQS